MAVSLRLLCYGLRNNNTLLNFRCPINKGTYFLRDSCSDLSPAAGSITDQCPHLLPLLMYPHIYTEATLSAGCHQPMTGHAQVLKHDAGLLQWVSLPQGLPTDLAKPLSPSLSSFCPSFLSVRPAGQSKPLPTFSLPQWVPCTWLAQQT